MTHWQLTPLVGSVPPIVLKHDKVTFGRQVGCTIVLDDDKCSRVHCELIPDDKGGWTLNDLKSRNGTKVNDQRISGPKVLVPGDILKIGSHQFLVEAASTITDPSADSSVAADPAELGMSDIGGFPISPPAAPLFDAIEVGLAEAGEYRSSNPSKAGPTAAPAITRSDRDLPWQTQLIELIDTLPPTGQEPERVNVIDAGGKPSAALAGSSEGPNSVRLILQLASKTRATDVHIEPKRETFNIRMRIDGQMVQIVELPHRVGELFFGLIKTACQMRVAGHNSVQEGHFSAMYPDRRVEFRVSFTPSVHGQKLVLRVLDERGIPKSLAEMGLVQYMIDRVERVCMQDHGLLLVCGPTGSGKTTTLYNALRKVDRETRNVITIEDPVEYQLEGVTQIPVDDHKGNSFGSMLRSVLRQDPDVILVGEIRDEETARTAMQAAMTGHVVFTTLHAKDTVTAVFRLLDLKVEPYLVANALDLVLAQRLVRVLCEHCKHPIPIAPGVATRLGKHIQGKDQMLAATGCNRCLRTGYRGRRAIFELLEFNDELRDVVLHNPTISAMKKVIETGLFTTLPQYGWRLVGEGVTSLDEVDHVAGQG